MDTRFIDSEEGREGLINFIKSLSTPFAVSIFDGDKRSTAQNRLQRLLCNEISSQWDGHSPEDVRAYCKLHHGIPILREDSEAYAEVYDRIVRPMSYQEKIGLMQLPIDLPVTRIMTKDQKTRYLDAIYNDFSAKGFILTRPEDG